MNVICKIIGHSMWFDYPDVTAPAHCKRWKCNHKEPAMECEAPVMLKVKEPKIASIFCEHCGAFHTTKTPCLEPRIDEPDTSIKAPENIEQRWS